MRGPTATGYSGKPLRKLSASNSSGSEWGTGSSMIIIIRRRRLISTNVCLHIEYIHVHAHTHSYPHTHTPHTPTHTPTHTQPGSTDLPDLWNVAELTYFDLLFADQIREIRKMSIARILCDTLDDVETIQPFALLLPLSDALRYVIWHSYKSIYL